MHFSDRRDAGRRLAGRLSTFRGEDVVVLGLPRGGVPVAAEVAEALGAPLDVVMVRKLGLPSQPELAMGAIGEDGVRVLRKGVLESVGVTDEELSEVQVSEAEEMNRRALRYRTGRERVDLRGRTAVVVDDGLATGSTARAACRVVRAHGASRVVLAVPVAPRGWTARLAGVADELVCLTAPSGFLAVGQWYLDFAPTTDEEVIGDLDRAARRAGVHPVHRPSDSAAGSARSPSAGPPAAKPVSDPEVRVDAGPVRPAGMRAVPPSTRPGSWCSPTEAGAAATARATGSSPTP